MKNIYDNLQKFKSAKPISTNLGIKEEIDKLNSDMQIGVSKVSDAWVAADKVVGDMRSSVTILVKASGDAQQGLREIVEAVTELQDGGIEPFGGVPWEESIELAESMEQEIDAIIKAIHNIKVSW